MSAHLDGDVLAELPGSTQDELRAWARANWNPAHAPWLKGRLPDLDEDMSASYEHHHGSLANVIRDDGNVRYCFFAEGQNAPVFSFSLPETVPLPEHLKRYFSPDLNSGPVDVGDAFTTGILPNGS